MLVNCLGFYLSNLLKRTEKKTGNERSCGNYEEF